MILPLPWLELAEISSPFDEAVIVIDGHEEETITVSCTGSRELAEAIVELVNGAREGVIDVPAFLREVAKR
jgi:hypothetical protein